MNAPPVISLILLEWWRRALAVAVVILFGAVAGRGEDVQVGDADGLRAALAGAGPGTVIRLAGGQYAGGFYVKGLRGDTDRPVVVAAAEATNPPVLSGAQTGLHLASPAHVELRGLVFTGLTANGFGTTAPVVFAAVDGAIVRFNTIDNPDRWAVRILQESGGPEFVPCRNGVFTDNVVRFHSERWSGGGVNVGGGTAPATFTFSRNWWHCIDRPDRSRPQLPVPESDGHYGRGPDAGNDVAGAAAWKEKR